MKGSVLILLSFFYISVFAQNGSKNFIDKPYIEVVGKAEMEVVPNIIYLNIKLNEKDYNQSLDEIEKKMIAKLQAIGIVVEDKLSIKDMASNLKTYWIKSNDIFENRTYQLIVDNATTAGKVFRDLESANISNIYITKLDHTDIQQFRNEVKVNAIKAAKTKANNLTEAIGQSIGKAIYIEELENPTLNRRESRSANMSNFIVTKAYEKEKSGQEPEIEFEKIKLQYAVLARFEM